MLSVIIFVYYKGTGALLLTNVKSLKNDKIMKTL